MSSTDFGLSIIVQSDKTMAFVKITTIKVGLKGQGKSNDKLLEIGNNVVFYEKLVNIGKTKTLRAEDMPCIEK